MKRKCVLLISLVIFSLMVCTHSLYGAEPSFLWEKTITPPYPYTQVSGGAYVYLNLVIYQGQYTIPGTESNSYQYTSIGAIKVYDISTGNLKWERIQSGVVGLRQGYNIQLDNNIIYMYNYFYRSTSNVPSISLPTIYGAYNVDNGQILWEKTINDLGEYSFSMSKNGQYYHPDNKLIITIRASDSSSVNFKLYQVASMTSPAINNLILDK